MPHDHSHAPSPLSRRGFLMGSAAVGCACGLSACTSSPTGNTFFGIGGLDSDIDVGKREHPKLVKAFGGVYDNPRLQRYVDQIGQRLAAVSEAPNLPYTFTIANSPIVNAFALPGGPVTVTRGLLALCDSEAELAGVIGHEIGHVTARHSAERQGQALLAQLGVAALGIATGSNQVAQLANYGALAFLQSYSRGQEMEADRLGARYLDRANYDVDAMVGFLDSMYAQSKVEARMLGLPEGKVDDFNMMATHPRTKDRVEEAMKIAAVTNQQNAIVGREVYMGALDGMLFGDDPEQGIVYGRRFAHPELRFEFTVPEGFRLMNAPDKVLARDQQGDLIVFDMARHGSRSMTDYIAREWARGARLSQVESLEVNGMEGATAATRGTVNGKTMDVRLVAVRKDGNEVYRLMFASLPANTGALAVEFRRTTYSLRRLTPAEAAEVKPLVLFTGTARPGDTVAGLASALPYGRYNDDWFRLLNDLAPGQGIDPQRLLKVVRPSDLV